MARIKAAIVVAIAGLMLMPMSAGALGLGEIDLKSALNQPFRAEILVASEAPGDLDGLRVEIASAETFEQFGLDRAAFLNDFQFNVAGQANGAVVQITSTQPVVEPFVTLLLKVSWPQGRLLREYTVLLDPPVFATQPVQPAVAAPTAGPSAPTSISDTDDRVPVKSVGGEQQRAVVQSSPAAVPDAEGGTYGPVQRNDTLWAIAGRLVDGSQSVSRNQMMLALYQENPEAFTGNINRLKAGMILRVPAESEVALSGREATAEVQRQNKAWRSAATGRTEGRGESQGGRLRLVPPPERDAEAAAPGAQVGTGEGQGAASDGRVNELENQLAESRRQLQVRDQELEALQGQLASLANQREAEPVSDEPELVPEPEAQPDSAGDAGVPSVTDTATEPETQVGADDAAEPVPVDVTPVKAASEEQSFLGALFTNPLVYLTLVIVLLLAWLVARNRSKADDSAVTGRWEALDAADDDQDDEVHEATTRLRAQPTQDETFVVEESAPPADATDEGSVTAFADESAEDWGALEEESETPLERTISTDSAVNLDQADPIAESDFHMAYGLYDQAADLLTKAVEVDLERKDLRMKLLEVYFIWENQDGFLQEAVALQERIGETGDADWNKVLIMGKQICPDEGIFSGDAVPTSSADSVDLEFGEDGGADEIDIALDDGDESSVDLQFDEESAGLDLDLTGGDLSEEGQHADEGGLDFDIGDDDLEMSGDAPTMETPTIESPAIDSTLETPTVESPAMGDGESTMETPTIETEVGQWDDPQDASPEATAEINLDDLDLDLDLSGLDGIGEDDIGDDEGGVTDVVADSEETDFPADTLEFDAPGEETQQRPAISLGDLTGEVKALDDPDPASDVDSTAEMPSLDSPKTGDTVEQPSVGGDTAEQPSLVGDDDDFVLDIGEPIADDDLTGAIDDADTMEVGGGVEGATMTEVGTKLDLARAYIDMGDPDGARSILNEVLEEAGEDQRQEAQKRIDDLDD